MQNLERKETFRRWQKQARRSLFGSRSLLGLRVPGLLALCEATSLVLGSGFGGQWQTPLSSFDHKIPPENSTVSLLSVCLWFCPSLSPPTDSVEWILKGQGRKKKELVGSLIHLLKWSPQGKPPRQCMRKKHTDIVLSRWCFERLCDVAIVSMLFL